MTNMTQKDLEWKVASKCIALAEEAMYNSEMTTNAKKFEFLVRLIQSEFGKDDKVGGYDPEYSDDWPGYGDIDN